MKSVTELKYESLPMGFDNGQVRLTDENIGRILRFSGAPLGLLRCCEAKGSGTVVLYGDGQAFIIPVETRYFLDCIGRPPRGWWARKATTSFFWGRVLSMSLSRWMCPG